MRILKRLSLVLVAVSALGAMSVSSASAIAPLFLAHPPGTLLLASAGTPQKLVAGGHTIECKAVKITEGTPPALQFLRLLVTVQYTECTADGILAATIHPVRYLIDANGLVKLVNTVLVLATSLCTVTIPATGNESLANAITFHNNAANRGLLLLVKATNITASGVGSACTFSTTTGTDEGTIHVVAHGGTLRWDLNT